MEGLRYLIGLLALIFDTDENSFTVLQWRLGVPYLALLLTSSRSKTSFVMKRSPRDQVNPCGAVIFVVQHTPPLQVCEVSQMAMEDALEPVIVQLHWFRSARKADRAPGRPFHNL